MVNAITKIDIRKTTSAKKDFRSGSSFVTISVGGFIFRGAIGFCFNDYARGILTIYPRTQILSQQISCDLAYIFTLIKSSVQFQNKYKLR